MGGVVLEDGAEQFALGLLAGAGGAGWPRYRRCGRRPWLVRVAALKDFGWATPAQALGLTQIGDTAAAFEGCKFLRRGEA